MTPTRSLARSGWTTGVRDLENLRRHLEEGPPTDEIREAARERLLARYASTGRGWALRVPFVLTSAAAVVAVVVLTVRTGPVAAWSPIPVSPPETSLQASAGAECSDGSGDPEAPLLIDQRRDVAVALFGERSDEEDFHLTCTLIKTDEGWRRATGDDLSFRLLVVSGSVDEAALDSRIDRVVIDAEGAEVEVSYENGFYLIWWPEEVALIGSAMRFLASDGSTILEIPLNSPRRGPPG